MNILTSFRSVPPLRSAGFTLLELVVVLLIATTMAAVAAPSFKGALSKYRIDNEKKALRDSLQLAHDDSFGETALTVCATANGTTCSTGKNWHIGHILFVDEGVVGKVDGTDVILERTLASRAGYTIVSVEEANSADFTRGYVHFEHSKPDLKKAVKFTVCTQGATPQHITINTYGHIWSTKGTTPCA